MKNDVVWNRCELSNSGEGLSGGVGTVDAFLAELRVVVEGADE
ncbi:MAG TPA: hypothetical protein VF614_04220 [Chthoniobacteraceae bacterium]